MRIRVKIIYLGKKGIQFVNIYLICGYIKASDALTTQTVPRSASVPNRLCVNILHYVLEGKRGHLLSFISAHLRFYLIYNTPNTVHSYILDPSVNTDCKFSGDQDIFSASEDGVREQRLEYSKMQKITL